MVQILPARNDSIMDQFLGGIQRGSQRGAEFSKLALQAGLKRKQIESERAKKLSGLEDIKKTPFWEKATDLQKAAIEREILGDLTGKTASSLINAEREQKDQEGFINALKGMNGGGKESPPSPSGMENFEDNDLQTSEPSSQPTKNSNARNFDEEIRKWQSTLPLAKTPQARATVESHISELQNLRNMQQKRNEEQSKRDFIPQEEYIKHAAKENASFLDEVGQIEKDLPVTEFALAGIEDALGNANKWAAFRDQIAEKTGFEGARSAAGAQLDSFIKSYFLGDLSSIKGGRPNVFIEKQIRDAYQKAGRDPIANQKTLVGMRMKEEINRLLVEKTREMEKNYIKKQGFIPPGFKSQVREAIKDKVTQIEKKTVDTLHHMSKIEENRDKIFRAHLKSGEVLMMDENGQPFAVPKKEVTAYREQGYFDLGEK